MSKITETMLDELEAVASAYDYHSMSMESVFMGCGCTDQCTLGCSSNCMERCASTAR